MRPNTNHHLPARTPRRPSRATWLAVAAGAVLAPFTSTAAAQQTLDGATITYETLGLGWDNVSGTVVVGEGPEFTVHGNGDRYEVDIDATGVTITARFDNPNPLNTNNWGTVNGLQLRALRLSGLGIGCLYEITDLSVSGTATAGGTDVILMDDAVQIGELSIIGTNRITWRHDDTLRVDFDIDRDPSHIPSYTTAFDIPGSTLPGAVPSGSRVNIGSGGSVVGRTFGAADGSVCDVQVNLFNGGHAEDLTFEGGAELNVFEGAMLERAGSIDGDFIHNLTIGDGAIMNLHGGFVQSVFNLDRGGVVNMTGGVLGGERLDAVVRIVNLDGTTNLSGGRIANTVSLSGELNMSGGVIEGFLGGQEGGLRIDGQRELGAPILNMSGGEINTLISTKPENTQFNMTGGLIRDANLGPFAGWQLNVHMLGGTFLSPNLGTQTSISVRPHDPMNFTMAGGRLTNPLFTYGIYHIRGGSFSWDWLSPTGDFPVQRAGLFTFYGERFAIDGVPISGLDAHGDRVAIDVPGGGVFSGVLEDGTPFSWDNAGDKLVNLELFVERTQIEGRPYLAWNDGDREYGGITDGRTLELQSGTMPAYFRMESGATLHLNGGSHAGALAAGPGSTFIFDEGSLGGFVLQGGSITMRGGVMGNGAFSGAIAIDQQGGTITDVVATAPVTATLSGGRLDNMDFRDGGTITQSGGVLGVTTTGGSVAQTGGNATVLMDGGTVTRTNGRGNYVIAFGDLTITGGDDTDVSVRRGTRAVISGGNGWYEDTEVCIQGVCSGEIDETQGFEMRANMELDNVFLPTFTEDELNSTVAQLHVTAIKIDEVDYTHLLQEDTPFRVPLVVPWMLSNIDFTPEAAPTGFPIEGRFEATLLDGQLTRTRLEEQIGILELVLDAQPNGPCSSADMTTEGSDNGVPDNAVTLSDFSYYLSLWAMGESAADLTTNASSNGVPDGSVTLSDFSYYLTLWSQGCP